jgi:hypothetical protein
MIRKGRSIHSFRLMIMMIPNKIYDIDVCSNEGLAMAHANSSADEIRKKKAKIFRSCRLFIAMPRSQKGFGITPPTCSLPPHES